MQFKAVARGKYRQLVHATSGTAVDITLFRCRVERPPHAKGDNTYLGLDLSDAVGDLDLLRKVDAFIQTAAQPSFSPVGRVLIVKVPRRHVSWELDDGSRSLDGAYALVVDQMVDVIIRPGAFGPFGYCLLLQRIKPHVSRDQEN